MTSMKTKKLNASAVSNAPYTPVMSTSTMGAKKGSRRYPEAAANQALSSARIAVVVSISAVNMSAAKGIATPKAKSPTPWAMTSPPASSAMRTIAPASDAPRTVNKTTVCSQKTLRKMTSRPAASSGTATNSANIAPIVSWDSPASISASPPQRRHGRVRRLARRSRGGCCRCVGPRPR